MGKSVHNEETKKLMEGILKLQSVDECYAFFEDLCTVNELLSLGQRFEVANMLRNHKTYNEVAEATGASTATISRVNRCLNYGTDGYQLVLGRMEEDKQLRVFGGRQTNPASKIIHICDFSRCEQVSANSISLK